MKTKLLFLILLACFISKLQAQNSPNIVLIMADDVSPHEFSSYGNSQIRTPTINELANSGVQFTSAWATPKCQSTRAMLMTGKYAYQTKWYHSNMRPSKNEKNWALYSHKIFSELTRAAGYKSLMVGKYQLNGEVAKHGFDEYFITGDGKNAPEGYGKIIEGKKGKGKPSCYWNPFVSVYIEGLHKPKWIKTTENDFGPEMELEYTLDFIDRTITDEKPFFVYLPVHLGNKNSNSSFPVTPLYNSEGKRTEMLSEPSMNAHIEYMDYMLSKIKKTLINKGELENTIFIITTDNGSAGFGKDDVTAQSGTRVPLIISGNNIQNRGIVNELTDLSDVFPTIADICNQEIKRVDGISLWPYLTGITNTHREWIYSNLTIHQMVRTQNLIRDGEGIFWKAEKDEPNEKLIQLKEIPTELKVEQKLISDVLSKIPAPSPTSELYKLYLEKAKPTKTGKKKPKKEKE